MGLSSLLFFIITLLLGGGVGYGLFFFTNRKNAQIERTTKSATILLERIEKVFKVVMAEGYFTEIFDYKDDKKFLYLFKNSKKALVIAKAKVLVGFDFGKMRFHIDETTNKMVIEYFPEPEVLSIDTDYKFYDIENGIWNRFSHEDYTNLLVDAKQAMNEKALSGDLPRIANNQVQFMIYQLASSMDWKIDMQLPEANRKQLEQFNKYEEVKAEPKILGEDEGAGVRSQE
jgi:hypothetical protein